MLLEQQVDGSSLGENEPAEQQLQVLTWQQAEQVDGIVLKLGQKDQ